MKVLGLHGFSHDAGACLICDGEIFAISEERLSRRKYEGRFPEEAIEYVLVSAGLADISRIDMCVCDTYAMSTTLMRRALRAMGYRGEIYVISHHDAHAASAYFASPFEESAVMVVDAGGSFARELPAPHPNLAIHKYSRELQSCYAGRRGKLELIKRTFSAPGKSLGPGTMYGFGAMMAGFSDIEGGKLMALAALGNRDSLFPDCNFTDFEGDLLTTGDLERDPLNPEHIEFYSKIFFKSVTPRIPSDPFRQIHCEIAHAVQEATSAAVIAIANHLYTATRCANLCVAGGFGLNCITNSAFSKKTPFRNIFVQPAATDAGIPLGAALYGYHAIVGQPFIPLNFSPRLGRKYSKEEILETLRNSTGLRYSRPKDLLKRTAQLLADGNICGWFSGRSEYGPRALGGRSILADARKESVRRRLNSEIKLRESFRPYAPAVIENKRRQLFYSTCRSPHMLFIAHAKPRAKKLIPSVLHVDGTARIQTVSEADDTRLYHLLIEFDRITNVPALLNTSFNRRGEPIVESPADAIECFRKTGMDFLVLEDFLVFMEE